jgi:hypothetical protein
VSERAAAGALGWAALLCAGLMSCATAAPAHGPSAPFEVTGNVADATVWVDDRMAGTASSFGSSSHRRIATGFHRLEIRHTGHYSHYQELDVKADVPQSVHFTLREILP